MSETFSCTICCPKCDHRCIHGNSCRWKKCLSKQQIIVWCTIGDIAICSPKCDYRYWTRIEVRHFLAYTVDHSHERLRHRRLIACTICCPKCEYRYWARIVEVRCLLAHTVERLRRRRRPTGHPRCDKFHLQSTGAGTCDPSHERSRR